MSDAVDVQDDRESQYDSSEDVPSAYADRPSILPPPTMPAALQDDRGAGFDEAPPPMPSPPAAGDGPERIPFLVKLGHRLCGFHR